MAAPQRASREAASFQREGSLRPRTPAAAPGLPRGLGRLHLCLEKRPGSGSCYLATAVDTGQADFRRQGAVGRVIAPGRVTRTGPSAAVIFLTWEGADVKERGHLSATHTQFPAPPRPPPQVDIAALGSLCHPLGVRDSSWTARRRKGLPPRKASSSSLHPNTHAIVDNIYKNMYCVPPDTPAPHSHGPRHPNF